MHKIFLPSFQVVIMLMMVVLLSFYVYYFYADQWSNKNAIRLAYSVVYDENEHKFPYIKIDTLNEKVCFTKDIIIDTALLHPFIEKENTRLELSDSAYIHIEKKYTHTTKEVFFYKINLHEKHQKYEIMYHKKYGILLKTMDGSSSYQSLDYVFIIEYGKKRIEWRNYLIDGPSDL